MIVLDTSATFELASTGSPEHERLAAVVAALDPPFLLSPFVLNELDYLIRTRLGSDPQRAFLREVAENAFDLCEFSAADVAEALDVIQSYAGLGLSLADASIVVLARRHGTGDLLSFDERDFRAIPGPGGRPFRLLPADL